MIWRASFQLDPRLKTAEGRGTYLRRILPLKDTSSIIERTWDLSRTI